MGSVLASMSCEPGLRSWLASLSDMAKWLTWLVCQRW